MVVWALITQEGAEALESGTPEPSRWRDGHRVLQAFFSGYCSEPTRKRSGSLDRVGLFVDAGYLLAAGGSLTVETGKRSEFKVEVQKLVKFLMDRVEKDSCLPLLRTYWYDACKKGEISTPEQKAVKEVDLVKLRLGTLNSRNEQKGVDALIFRDLTTLSRERAMCSAYLLAGDADMVQMVAMSQDLGIQVVLLSVIPAGDSGVAPDLIDEVDREIFLEKHDLEPFFKRLERRSPGDGAS